MQACFFERKACWTQEICISFRASRLQYPFGFTIAIQPCRSLSPPRPASRDRFMFSRCVRVGTQRPFPEPPIPSHRYWPTACLLLLSFLCRRERKRPKPLVSRRKGRGSWPHMIVASVGAAGSQRRVPVRELMISFYNVRIERFAFSKRGTW
jgi:hypothetical protein